MAGVRSACQIAALILVAAACIFNAFTLLGSTGSARPGDPAAGIGTSLAVVGPAGPHIGTLYRGCGAHQRPVSAPNLTIIGVQKGGTTFFGKLLAEHKEFKEVFCTSKTIEPHFFNEVCYAVRLPTEEQLWSGYLELQWSKRCHLQRLTFEKSPAAYLQPWIPLRMCMSLPNQKIVLLLRNPTTRAYSGFYQAQKVMKKGAMSLDRSVITFDENLFHALVVLEIAIATSCKDLFTGTGSFSADWVLALQFHECCMDIAEKRGHPQWPGCFVYGFVVPPGSSRSAGRHADVNISEHLCDRSLSSAHRCKENKVECGFPPFPSPGLRFGPRLGAFGDFGFDFVRQGIYVNFVQNWLTYHREENFLVLAAEDLKRRGRETLHEIVRFTCRDEDELCRHAHQIISDLREAVFETSVNSKTQGHKPMLANTRKLLDDFFAPHNEQLERVLGKSMHWSA